MAKFDTQYLEAQSGKFRRDHGLGRSDGLDFDALLRRLDIVTVFRPLGDATFSGMAVKHAGRRYMLINSSHTLGRQNFTIAHELYHLFVQRNFRAHVCQPGSNFQSGKEPEERNADWFAAHLLMPVHRILAEVADELRPEPHLSLASVVRLEQEFQCSRAALLVQLKERGLLNARQADEMGRNPAESARLHGYPTDLYRAGRNYDVIGDYAERATLLFDTERVSESHYAELLRSIGVSVSD